ncbi:MAG TPA: hypothetical protein PLO05_03765 [Bacteroidales bacterium]|jgi:cell division protein FtsL|nr:hypothetical protein [Bacteroidales bacterium]HRW22604.1 hypothetical protein [Bacteroidales bacterium]HXK81255.1 hypothetical protein [Bacteroidales bacterium]
MKRKLTRHEKLLIGMLIIAVIGVALSWERISEQAGKTWKLYTTSGKLGTNTDSINED